MGRQQHQAEAAGALRTLLAPGERVYVQVDSQTMVTANMRIFRDTPEATRQEITSTVALALNESVTAAKRMHLNLRSGETQQTIEDRVVNRLSVVIYGNRMMLTPVRIEPEQEIAS